jgi:inorganic pyrophosphatase
MVISDTFVLWFVPAAAVVGILFALTQWFIVSRVSVGGEGKGNNGYVHVEEDGISELEVVAKCAEIQSAISEGLCVRAVLK